MDVRRHVNHARRKVIAVAGAKTPTHAVAICFVHHRDVRLCAIGIMLAGLTLVGCGGGSDSGTDSNMTPTKAVTVGSVKQCLGAGGATRVNGAAEGTKGTVTARGPGGTRIFIGLYADPAEAEKLSQEDAAAFPEGTFESIGRAVVGLAEFVGEDRELARQCAGGA